MLKDFDIERPRREPASFVRFENVPVVWRAVAWLRSRADLLQIAARDAARYSDASGCEMGAVQCIKIAAYLGRSTYCGLRVSRAEALDALRRLDPPPSDHVLVHAAFLVIPEV